MIDVQTHETLIPLYASVPVLVTGSSGFLGSNLTMALRTCQAQITEFDADIRDSEAMACAVAGQEIIFHLAGVSGAVHSNAHPFEDLDVNGRGLLTLLEACRHINPGARVIFPSSRLVYGLPQTLPVTETHPTRPLSMYGVHKLLAEHYLRLYHQLYGGAIRKRWQNQHQGGAKPRVKTLSQKSTQW